jgi:hypothetical protein
MDMVYLADPGYCQGKASDLSYFAEILGDPRRRCLDAAAGWSDSGMVLQDLMESIFYNKFCHSMHARHNLRAIVHHRF